jgi:hypothetical protein
MDDTPTLWYGYLRSAARIRGASLDDAHDAWLRVQRAADRGERWAGLPSLSAAVLVIRCRQVCAARRECRCQTVHDAWRMQNTELVEGDGPRKLRDEDVRHAARGGGL